MDVASCQSCHICRVDKKFDTLTSQKHTCRMGRRDSSKGWVPTTALKMDKASCHESCHICKVDRKCNTAPSQTNKCKVDRKFSTRIQEKAKNANEGAQASGHPLLADPWP